MKKEIIAECCELFKVHQRDLLGPTRYAFLLPARFALYKALTARGWSHIQTADLMNRDRSTINNGLMRAEYMMERSPKYAEKVQHLIDFKPSYVDQSTIAVAHTDSAAYDTTPSRSRT